MLTALKGSNDKNDREDVKDRTKDLPPPQLVPKEKARAFNLGTILAEAFLTVKKKNEKDTFGSTVTSTPAARAEREALKAEKEGKKPFKLPLLATLAIGITAFATWLSDFLGPVGEFITKTLPTLFKPMIGWADNVFKGMGKIRV